MSNIRYINPATHAKPPGYTHVVEVTGPGRMVFIAGQLGMDRDGNFVGDGDFSAQATQVFENLKAALAAVGGGLEHIVKVTNFLTDLKHLPAYREVRERYLVGPNLPASTLVEISALARPDALIEIEAIAALPARAARSKPTARATKAKAARVTKPKAARRKRR
jgi:enamine deaminase RidA (YjgF/YER057c/UK114 family)